MTEFLEPLGEPNELPADQVAWREERARNSRRAALGLVIAGMVSRAVDLLAPVAPIMHDWLGQGVPVAAGLGAIVWYGFSLQDSAAANQIRHDLQG